MKHLYKFLGILLVWVIAAGANAQTITNITNSTYTEHAPAITIHPNFTVTGGDGFGGGYMLFDLTNGSLGDQLGIKSDANPNDLGAISVSGTGIFLGNGTGTNIIGSIDGVLNGQNGQKLRINFTSNFENPSFESGLSGWTVVNQQIFLGQTQLFGFTTPADPTYPSNTRNKDLNVPASATYSYQFSTTEKTQGNQSLRLYASMTTALGCDVVHGGYAYSAPFQSNAGDVLSFDWRALGGSDAYDIFCYIVNVNTGASTIVLNQTGANTSAATAWAPASVSVPTTGTYRFVFVSGTWDQTCGRAAGASLYIDNVKVFGNNVTPEIITSLARHITYQNNCGVSSATRNLTVTLAKPNNTTVSTSSTIELTTYPPVAVAKNLTAALGSNGQVTVSPAAVNNGSTDDCSMTFTLSKSSFTCTNIGDNPVVLTVTDPYGNAATANAVITVVDNTAPVIVCPSNLVITAPQGSCNAAVTVPALTATDNCTASANIVIKNSFNNSADASGTYPIGVTNVVWTATDAYGNTQTCTQNITVQAPEINLTGNNTNIVNDSQTPSENDNTGFGTVTTATQVTKSFVIQNSGTSVLTVQSIGISGANAGDFTMGGITLPVSLAPGATAGFSLVFQSATAGVKNAQVTINNTDCDEATYRFAVTGTAYCTAPVFSNLNPYLQASTAANSCNAVVNYALAVSGTPAPNVNYTFSGATTASGTGTGSDQTFNKGITHVTVTAVNGCGTPSVSFDVTVVDNVPPVVKTKNTTLYLDNTGKATLNAASLDDGSTDNCGAVTFLTNSSGIICATAAEGSWLTITAPAGKLISAIDFASYGSPTGTCGNFALGACHSSLSMSVLSQAIGKNSFTIAASNAIFGDPCYGTVKRLCVQASYASTGTSNVYDCSKLGNNTATLIVTDAAGNSASGTATVTVVDNISPKVVTRNIAVCLDQNGNAVITPAQINNGSTDNCSIASYALSQTDFTSANVGANTVTLSVTDGSGNVGTATAIVTVNGQPIVSVEKTDVACAGGASGSLVVSVTGGSTPYLYSRNGGGSYQASNTFAGLTAGTYYAAVRTANGCVSAVQPVVIGTVVDVTNPTITAPASVSVNADLGYCGAAVNLGSPVASDNCGVQSVVNNSSSFLTGGRYPIGVTTITWTVTDRSGNTSTATQTVTVTDNQAPLMNIPVDISVNNDAGVCGAAVAATAPATSDNCGLASVAGVRDDGKALDEVYPVGVTTITWTATDLSGLTVTQTQTVTVKDNIAPVPTVAELPVLTGECSVTVPLPIAVDNCGGIISGVTEDPLVYTAQGTYTVNWVYRDASGNAVSQTQTVIVKDITAPVPQVATLPTISGLCSAVVINAPKATDNCTGVITATTSDQLIYTTRGTYTIVWKYDDGNGNTTTQNQTIMVTDATPPVVTAPADTTVNCGGATAPAATGTATATDNCHVSSITYTDETTGNLITRTWKATDPSGNTGTAIQKIAIGAVFAPYITSVPTTSTYTGGVATNLYLGYGAQSTALQVGTLPSVGAPYRYSWTGSATNLLNSTSSAAPVFSPVAAGSYTFVVTVTNRYNCSYTTSITICVTDIRVPGTKGGAKVFVCHATDGKNGSHTIEISVNAVPAHLNGTCGGHGGDRLGSCEQAPCNSGSSSAFATTTKQTVTQEMAAKATTAAAVSEAELAVTVMPNPSTTYFTLKLTSRSDAPVSLRVLDGTGRTVEARTKLQANSSLQVGHTYSSGTYYAEFTQGGRRKVVQLIKTRG
ncbi:HYR domain-containing protein [Sediminibacterium soli]|uniref:HYR domain-containing protein n=1 Tax=Sediminibacterium soli TaxID=2698829 RepID=UPI00137B86FE|nr:HYR domain-containing protein [Sediminibacterium soli]NCI46521.1 HYR domain-containing protein [Sediminibacterium soli]